MKHEPIGRQTGQRVSMLRREAARLQSMGLNPIPLKPKGSKVPFLKKGELKYGLFRRRSDSSDIEEWTRRTEWSTNADWRWDNLGLVTGRTSGLLVVDEDHEDAWAFLSMLGVHKDTKTWKWSTGRGWQMAFKLPEGLEVPNFHGKGRLLRDVPFDIKGESGYVVVPPSVHSSGREYRYVDGFSPWECPLAEAPSGLLAAICRANKDVGAGTDLRDVAAKHVLPSEIMDRLQAKNERLVALSSPEPSNETGTLVVPMDEDLREQLGMVKKLFFKHDVPVSPILEGSRKLTLGGYFRRITRNQEIGPKELRRYLRMANNTLLYDREGKHLCGLEEEELEELFDLVTRNLPRKSSPEVQEKLVALKNFVGLLLPKLKRPRDTDAKVTLALAEHGIKYGGWEDGKIRVDVSRDIIRCLSRIKNDKTLDRSLKRMETKGIKKGRDTGAPTNHYLLDLTKLLREGFWGVSSSIDPKGGVGDDLRTYNSPTPPLGIREDESRKNEESLPVSDQEQRDNILSKDYEEIVHALFHTTHHGGVGQASVRQIMAFLKLGTVQMIPVHTQELADELDVERGSIYKTLTKLREHKIVEMVGRGYYCLTENFLDNFHRMRKKKGEFEKDEIIREGVEENRKVIGYENDLFRAAREGKDLETVPVPSGVPTKRVLNAKAKTLAKQKTFADKIEAVLNGHLSLDELTTYEKRLLAQYGVLVNHVEMLRIKAGDEEAAAFAKEQGYYHPVLNPNVLPFREAV